LDGAIGEFSETEAANLILSEASLNGLIEEEERVQRTGLIRQSGNPGANPWSSHCHPEKVA